MRDRPKFPNITSEWKMFVQFTSFLPVSGLLTWPLSSAPVNGTRQIPNKIFCLRFGVPSRQTVDQQFVHKETKAAILLTKAQEYGVDGHVVHIKE